MNTYSIGIDIGGTNTDIGLVRDDGRCLAKKNITTRNYFDASIYVSDVYDQIKLLMTENGVDAVDGIGVAAPVGNYYTGCIENASNLNFKGVTNLRKMFGKYTDAPVVVSNDANAAAYGELIYGGARSMKHFIMFTLGTGVGSGIVVDGKLVLGKTGGAGELGHAILIPDGRLCGCGGRGCLETYTSSKGIVRTTVELLEQRLDYKGPLSHYKPSEISSKMVGEAANDGDPLAIEVFEKTGYWLGIAMANAVTFSGPEAIFLMGGPVKAGEALLKPLRKSFEEHLCFIFRGSVDIRVSELPDNDAAILGAAALTKALW